MNNLVVASKRGGKVLMRMWWKWMQIPILIVGVAGIIAAPWGLSLIDPLPLKLFSWAVFLVVIMITAICVGLTPYWGQREIMNDALAAQKKEFTDILSAKDQEIANCKRWEDAQSKMITEWHNKADVLERELNQRKQQ